MKMLCVDDSALARKLVARAGQLLGMDVLSAGNAEEALELIEVHREDIRVITLDWHMPGMSGLEFLSVVKECEWLRHIPILMLTSESSKDNIVEAVKAGVNDYLLKPFSQEELLLRLQKCIQQQQQPDSKGEPE